MISGVLLDLAGVLYDGEVPIPGGAEAVVRLRDAGLPLRFVSNTTRSTKQAVLDQLARLGLSVRSDELFTPAQAAREWLSQHNRSPHLLIHPDLVADFGDPGDRAGKVVIVGDAGEAFTYSALNDAFRVLVEGAELLALAPNRTFKDADGKLSLDAGPFVTALEFASQKQALVLGKPSSAFFLSALASMNCPEAEAVMVGDDAETDVAGALRAGLASALLVRTGKYRAGDEDRFRPGPTVTVDDIAAAADWIIAARNG
ncbi:TIGR01458 family HAD-type hydrolase [Phyllobacterium brassicacearum]|uniref:Phospholysine phosphohistidine inorganic pyrophosphate phosphatase n=1 Tax=Phyllobacterium brassicacearum TaxID=314235 RepID=A0A2P7BRC9_9HYPH|nr:TIGR01458 family HAD-type hydrolase [Phyllobacterium brassicacearum]PSH69018.1 TIGR01458 family HAD-type hydrolase [Phyllobacterium brassicacearum]TDQ25262.1 HAD superfamily hydrolase (TIGR01458 family) [Phyllobacterium brassicacearum]